MLLKVLFFFFSTVYILYGKEIEIKINLNNIKAPGIYCLKLKTDENQKVDTLYDEISKSINKNNQLKGLVGSNRLFIVVYIDNRLQRVIEVKFFEKQGILEYEKSFKMIIGERKKNEQILNALFYNIKVNFFTIIPSKIEH